MPHAAANSAVRLQRILVDFPVLHDDIELVVGVSHDLYILQRIPVDELVIAAVEHLDVREYRDGGLFHVGGLGRRQRTHPRLLQMQ